MPKDDIVMGLQKQCRVAGLPDGGNMSQLIQRLIDHLEWLESNDESESDSFSEAVLATQASLSSDQESKNDAEVALREEVSKGELEVANLMGEVYVGNCRGLDLIGIKKELDIQKAKAASHEAKIASHKAKIASLEDTVDRLDNYVSTMRLSLKEYKSVRQRFITMYKRDKLHMVMTPTDQKIIREGNTFAHTGDAAIDSLLYEGTEGRDDFTIFTKLYGIHPFIVREIKHKETLALLNLHAEVEANTKKRGTKEFYEHFRVFVTEFQESDLRADYLSSPTPTTVAHAYWKVLRCHKYQDNE